MDKVRVVLGAWVLGAWVAFPAIAAAQEDAGGKTIVANQVAVSQRDASLTLELDDGESLEITFRNGTVELNGAVVGNFERNDALESSWRELLGSAVGVSTIPLASLLSDWTAPTGLDDEQANTASLLDSTLEEFVIGQVADAAQVADVEATANAVSEAARSTGQVGLAVSELLRSRDLLKLLDELGDLDLDLDELRVSVGEDLTIRRGEQVDSDVLVFGGDLDVRGEIDGNVVVSDGRVRLFEGGVITGDVRLSDATFSDYGGQLDGRRSRIRADQSDEFQRMRDELRIELRTEIRDELESELHDNFDWRPRGGIFNPFRHFWAGLMGLFHNVLTFGIMTAVGAILLYFNSTRMAAVVETARTSTAKSAAVGIAGTFLFFPVWVLGIVVLTISIIGIPALLLWVPLLPLATAFAALFGIFAVSAVIGEWAQSREFRFLEWADDPNAFYRMVSGLLVVTSLFAGANVLRMGGPLLGFFHGLLAFIACLVALGVMFTGFGAVLLTWSQNRSVHFNADFDEDWTWRDWGRRSQRSGTDAAAEAAAAATAAAEGVADAATTMADDAADIVDDAVEAVDDVVDAVADEMDEVVETVTDEVTETIEDIKDALDDLGDDVDETPES